MPNSPRMISTTPFPRPWKLNLGVALSGEDVALDLRLVLGRRRDPESVRQMIAVLGLHEESAET
jgi:hypothetical protein